MPWPSIPVTAFCLKMRTLPNAWKTAVLSSSAHPRNPFAPWATRSKRFAPWRKPAYPVYLDPAVLFAGPVIGTLLADFGATVIRVVDRSDPLFDPAVTAAQMTEVGGVNVHEVEDR